MPFPVNQAGTYCYKRKKGSICGDQSPLNPCAKYGGAEERCNRPEKDAYEQQRRAKDQREHRAEIHVGICGNDEGVTNAQCSEQDEKGTQHQTPPPFSFSGSDS